MFPLIGKRRTITDPAEIYDVKVKKSILVITCMCVIINLGSTTDDSEVVTTQLVYTEATSESTSVQSSTLPTSHAGMSHTFCIYQLECVYWLNISEINGDTTVTLTSS